MPKLSELIESLVKTNIELWHREDEAVSEDDRQVAEAKRRITKLNRERNDFIEAIDDWIITNARKKGPNNG